MADVPLRDTAEAPGEPARPESVGRVAPQRHDDGPFVGVVTSLAFAAYGFVRIGDSDAFFHVASGRDLLRDGLPLVDRYSYASGGRLAYVEGLADVFSALAVDLGGFAAYGFAYAVVLLLVGAATSASIRAAGASGAVVGALAAAASARATSAKPQLFTYLLFAALVAYLVRVSPTASFRRVLGAFAVGVLAANLHRGAIVVAPVLVLAACVGAVVGERVVARAHALTAAAFTIGLTVNPGGLFYFTSAFDLARRSSFRDGLEDWRAPTFAQLIDGHVALLPLLALALLAFGSLRNNPRVLRAVPALLVAGFLATRSVRMLPLLALASVPLAAEGLASIAGSARAALAAVRPSIARAACVVVAFAITYVTYTGATVPAFRGFGVAASRLPVDTARFLAAHEVPGRMWNAFDFGGYLLYALGPEVQVLVDGRNDTVYSDRHFRACLDATHDLRAFRSQVVRYGIDYVVVPYSGPNDRRMDFVRADPAFQLVHFDDVAAVFVRRSARTQAYLARYGYRVLALDTMFARAYALDRDPARADLEREIARAVREAPSSMVTGYLRAFAARARRDAADFDAARVQLETLAYDRGLPFVPP